MARSIVLIAAAGLCALFPMISAEAMGETIQRIAIDVLEPDRRTQEIGQFPVSVGLVFPDGELKSIPGGRVVDESGQPVPFEAEVTGWWDREHTRAKWLLLHFNASPGKQYAFEIGQAPAPPAGAPLASIRDGAVVVDTGPLKARIAPGQANLFAELLLNGKPILQPLETSNVLVADDGSAQTPGTLESWDIQLESATPHRASIKAGGVYRFPDAKPMARIDLRYQFFKGEPFVRVYHTFTWMVQDVAMGVRELGLRLKPTGIDSNGRVRIGTSPDSRETYEIDWSPGTSISATQESGTRFSVVRNGTVERDGTHLGGWIELAGDDGRRVSVALRYAWQTYPTELAVTKDGLINLSFWPGGGERMSFTPEAIMGSEIFYHPSWKRYEFSKDAGHFVNNYEKTKGFMYTAEGAALTHELLIGLYDDATMTRSVEQLAEVTNRPLVLRQDPAAAMRVPFMGFDLMPRQLAEKYADIERAVDQLGAIAMGRWIGENNFGLLRFGMVRWSKHSDETYYRWMDNVQYDQQLIPWLLFMRGGDRRWFEDGEITSRYAMDMNVNHFNTRGTPPGYMATCGGALPFPNFTFVNYNMKGQKLHFLAYYYHLTGYPRAKDVLDTVIRGTTEFTRQQKKDGVPLSGGREMYNMNMFWANAYEETLDPEIAEYAADSRTATIDREYHPDINKFDDPVIYLYNGLVLQDRVFADQRLRETMLKHLAGSMLQVNELGGIERQNDVIAAPWAYGQTGDDRYARVAWDVARGMADLVPDAVFTTGEEPPYYPYPYLGNSLLRQHLLPILTGASLGDRLNLPADAPRILDDLYVFLTPEKGHLGPSKGEVFVRSRKDGPLALRILGRAGKSPLHATISTRDGREIRTLAIEPVGRPSLVAYRADVELPSATAGEVYRIAMHGQEPIAVAVLGDAQIVHHLPEGAAYGNEPLSGGQDFTPVHMVTRATADIIAFLGKSKLPFTIRDAKTGELLLRPTDFNAAELRRNVGAGRMILLTVSGTRTAVEWTTQGMSPYFASSLERWFDPTE